nr:hypothetical protein [uncultured Acetatifactor sp.]
MRRKSLYTAIRRFERRTNHKGQAYPVILLGGNEYMADLQEMALWTSLNWRIARREEIASLYGKTISKSGFSAERPLETCIQRLLMRGLIVCGTGETEYDALYDLLAALYVLPTEGSILQRACAFLKFSLRHHAPLSAATKLFWKDRHTENERQVMGLARQALLSTAEIVKCFEKGIHSLPNEESIMDSLYDDEDTTSDNLPFMACAFPSSKKVVLAVANLYLRKQIILERI